MVRGAKSRDQDADRERGRHEPPGTDRITPQQAAAYIGDMLDGLTAMAEEARLSSLAYLLAVAAEEARDKSGDITR